MNPEKPSREEIELKLTALLLGELPDEEAQLLRWAISQDAELSKLHERLKFTIGFVREVGAHPAEANPPLLAPLKLSDERREKLLAHFKTIAPREFVPEKKRGEFSSLVMMAAAIALIAVLAAMLLPALAKSKNKAMRAVAMNQAKQQEIKARLAADEAIVDQKNQVVLTPHALPGGNVTKGQVVNNTPSQPQAALRQRVDSLEAYIQNGNPTATSGDRWPTPPPVVTASPAAPVFLRRQAQIVLPPSDSGTSVPVSGGGELATATPASHGFFDSGFNAASGNLVRDQSVQTIQLDNGDPYAVAQELQKQFGGTTAKTGATTTSLLATRAMTTLTTPQNNLAWQNNSPTAAAADSSNRRSGDGFGGGGAARSSTTSSGQYNSNGSVGTAQISVDPDTHNLVVTGDAATKDQIQDTLKNLDKKSSGSGTMALGGENNYGGGTIVGNGTLPVNKDGSGNLAYIDKLDNRRADTSHRLPGGEVINNPVAPMPAPSVSAAEPSGQFLKSRSLALGVDKYAPTSNFAWGSFDGSTNNQQEFSDSEVAQLNANGYAVIRNGQIVTVVNKNDAKTANIPVVVSASPQSTSDDNRAQLLTRTVKVDPNTFNQGLQSATTFSFGSTGNNNSSGGGLHLVTAPDTMEGVSVAAQTFFKTLGVDLTTPGKSIFYDDRLGELFVRGTPEDLATIQKALSVLTANAEQTKIAPPAAVAEDRPIQKTPSPAPVPQPEILTRENAFSTFSLNVSDVSFKLAAASLQNGVLPDAGSIRSEEFINAFDYRDPEPAAGVPVAFVSERARDPFANNRDLLRFSIKTAAQGRQAGRLLNIVLLLDNSGSMERADRVAIIHEALRVLASQLQPQDTLSIVTFARTARLWVDGVSGDHAGEAVSKVSDLTPEGGTNLEEAMKLAYATALRHYLANGGNRVVLLTDGAANLGNVDPETLKQKVESFRKQGIALDCFGIGWEGYNDDLLEQLSSNGDGRYGFINTPEEAATGFAAQLAGALQVAAEDVKVQVEFNPQRVISYRQIGYAKHQLTKEQFRDNTVAAAPLAAQEAGNALYTVEINPQGEGPVATVRVRFRIPGTQEVSEHEWPVPFDGGAPALEKSSPAMRLAATASEFSEWLAQSPFAQEVTTDQLLNDLNGVPEIYGADPRPKQLEMMIREAKSLSGK